MKILIALAALAVATPAFSQAPKSGSWQIGHNSFHIYYADLDMTSVTGRAQLLARVQKAADRLCADENDRKACSDEIVMRLPNSYVRQALVDREAVRTASR